jgi:hypothetical protein
MTDNLGDKLFDKAFLIDVNGLARFLTQIQYRPFKTKFFRTYFDFR